MEHNYNKSLGRPPLNNLYLGAGVNKKESTTINEANVIYILDGFIYIFSLFITNPIFYYSTIY